MTTTLMIDGGLGRVITAIPALEKYVANNPDTIILVTQWVPILWGNKILQNNVLDAGSKGLFEKIKNTKILKPEPYYNSDYISGKINLIDAWNQEINNCRESLAVPKLYLSKAELYGMSYIRNNYYQKIIAFQPFGSTAILTNEGVQDSTKRSINAETTQHLIKILREEGYGIWLMTDKPVPFLDGNNFINAGSNNIREVASLLYHCDYFLGVDSSGQHVARCFNKPGTVIMGGTNSINVSYPDHFNILNDRSDKVYMPYRLAEFDWWLSELANDSVLDFTEKDLKILGKNILKHINMSTKK